MATNLGKAYVQIMPSAKGISGMISKELDGEVSSAGKSAGNSLVSTIKSAVVAAGIGKLFASSLMEGGKLQQSLGGVETLFKNNANMVKQYANEAYKTTGLSANAYMETVTGFSASLLQSLGGDTAKAAKVANTAMVDMADNSNKMGTSMELIQNAYQGFAKQNYTMLDNLKLGYGGTKQEMQRLLADAQKLTGVKYDINNLSDVYEAIHVIQKELDITGTTAKEASTTLQGSFSSMKAAFMNLLGNLSLGNDIKPALQQLASTTMTFLVGNFLPMVGNILKGLPTLVIGAFSGLAEQLRGVFGDEVVNKIQGYLTQVSGAVESFMNVLTGSISKQEGIDLMKALGINEGTADSIASIAENIRTAFQNIWEAIKNVTAIVGEFVGDLLGINEAESSVSGVGLAFELLSDVVKKASEWIKDFTSFLRENEVALGLVKIALSAILGRFIALSIIGPITALINGFQTAITAARTAMAIFNAVMILSPMTALVAGITAAIAALVWFFTKTETGKAIWQGFVGFIKQAWNGVVEFFSGIWSGITTGATMLWTGIQAVWAVAVEEIKALWQGVTEFFSTLWTGIQTTASTAWNFITTSITAIVQPFIDAFLNGWEILKTGLTAVWEGVKMVIQGAWEFIKAIVMGAVLIVIDLVTGNFSKLKEDLQLIWEAIKAAVQLVWEGIKFAITAIVGVTVALIKNAWEGLKTGLEAIWNFLSTTASTIWNAIKSAVTSIVTGLVNGIKALWEGFKSFFTTLINTVQSIAVNTWNSIKSSVTSIIQSLVNAAQNAWNNFKNGVQNLVNTVKNIFNTLRSINLWEAGSAIMRSFLNGLKSVWESVKGFVSSIAGWIRDHKGPIELDRKLLIPAGTAIMESLDEGLTDKFESVKKTVSGMAGDINKAFTSEMTDFEVGANVSKNLQIDDMSKADFSVGDKDNDVIKALEVVQDLLKDISNKDFNTYLDGEIMAKNSYDRQMSFVRREGI